MTISLKVAGNTKEGYCGKVFFSNESAFKVFKKALRPSENDLYPINTAEEVHRIEKIFNSEVNAYEKAQGIDELKRYVMHFRGKCAISSVLDRDNNDISHTFLLHCAYEMKPIAGTLYNRGDISAIDNSLSCLFRKYGIDKMDDFSYFMDSSNNVTGIIDIAISDFPPSWQS